MVMDDLVRWLGEQLSIDAEAAHAAMVKLGDAEWYATQDLEHPGERYSVRSEPTCRAVARVQRIDGDEGERAGVLDGHAVAAYIAEWDPARVLREIDAKRAILALHTQSLRDGGCQVCDVPGGRRLRPDACTTVRLLVLPYADRPGYREAWRP